MLKWYVQVLHQKCIYLRLTNIKEAYFEVFRIYHETTYVDHRITESMIQKSNPPTLYKFLVTEKRTLKNAFFFFLKQEEM